MTHTLHDLTLVTDSYSALIHDITTYLAQSDAPAAHLVTLNPEIWVTSYTNAIVYDAIKSARWITADGIGIVIGQKLSGITPSPRRPGSDLTIHLLQTPGLRFYLLGSSQDVIDKARHNVTQRYPDAIIVGSHNGFFPLSELDRIATDIKDCTPDIILVGMGSPRQDQVILELKKQVNHGVFMGVGGVLDMLAGTVKRSPKWMQTLGIEWIWRVACQPQRLGRLCRSIPQFLWVVLRPPR